MSHCPQCKKLMRGVCRFCQPQEYIDVVQQALMDLADELTQRPWVNLTSEEIGEIYRVGWANNMELARAIEEKLKEKNE